MQLNTGCFTKPLFDGRGRRVAAADLGTKGNPVRGKDPAVCQGRRPVRVRDPFSSWYIKRRDSG
ncbi:MAG: hypothetical protein LBG57_12380, partial [Treponema sp.]|nr:hypothetical protein [Treponema sp.]